VSVYHRGASLDIVIRSLVLRGAGSTFQNGRNAIALLLGIACMALSFLAGCNGDHGDSDRSVKSANGRGGRQSIDLPIVVDSRHDSTSGFHPIVDAAAHLFEVCQHELRTPKISGTVLVYDMRGEWPCPPVALPDSLIARPGDSLITLFMVKGEKVLEGYYRTESGRHMIPALRVRLDVVAVTWPDLNPAGFARLYAPEPPKTIPIDESDFRDLVTRISTPGDTLAEWILSLQRNPAER
jgi:hypothetical protein